MGSLVSLLSCVQSTSKYSLRCRTSLVFAKMTEQTLIELENKEEKNNKSAFLKVKERFSIRSKSKNKKRQDIPETTDNNKESNGKNPEKTAEDEKDTTNEK